MSNFQAVASPLFGVNYWIGFSFSFLVIATLFIFKGFYGKISYFNTFRYFLGILQFLLYVLYFTFHQIIGDITWKDYMPFHLCSILDLTSAFLLIYPSEKLFSSTFPLMGPVILPFFFPDSSKQEYGLNSFFYYQYYFHHTLILFAYFYLYFYGHVKYNKFLLKQTCGYLTIFTLAVFVFNIVFATNFLFIGSAGISFSDSYWFLNTGNWSPVMRFLIMWSVGLGFILFYNYLIANFFPPFYFNAGREINEHYQNKVSFFGKIRNKLKKDKSLKNINS